MQWIENIPSKEGTYVVQTKSNVLGTVRTLQSTLTYTKGKPHWSFNNQTFYRYLDESR